MSTTVLLKLPVTVVQWAHLAGLEPARNTMEMEGVVANAPSYGALLARGRGLVRLTLNAEVHDVVSADGAVVDDNVPCPECDGVPLLDLEALLAVGGLGVTVSSLLDDAARGIGHVDVGHGGMLETAGFGGRFGGARRVLRKRKTGSRGAGSMSC